MTSLLTSLSRVRQTWCFSCKIFEMNSFSKSKKLLLGLGAFTGVATYCFFNDKHKVFASWTTNYEPLPYAKWDENWDHRSPEFLTRPARTSSEKDQNKFNEKVERHKPKVCRHILLIRHGQYNVDGNKDEERYLTKLGRIQAEFTGKRLKELNMPYTQLVISTMTRAKETGNIISSFIPEVPVSYCDYLREGAPIPPEPPIGGWKPEQHKFYQDGARIEAAFRKYFHRAEPNQEKDSYTILVCHANVIRYFVCRALQFPAEGWLRISLNHASITWLTVTPSGRCVLRQCGDAGHMPPENITST